MSRTIKLVQLALKVAELSDHRFSMGAVIARGSRVISFGVNKYKTHPLQINHHTGRLGGSIHAELDAILKAPYRYRKDSQMCIGRVLKDGSPGNARPCKNCCKLLSDSGIYIIAYSTSSGDVVKEDLRNGRKELEGSIF